MRNPCQGDAGSFRRSCSHGSEAREPRDTRGRSGVRRMPAGSSHRNMGRRRMFIWRSFVAARRWPSASVWRGPRSRRARQPIPPAFISDLVSQALKAPRRQADRRTHERETAIPGAAGAGFRHAAHLALRARAATGTAPATRKAANSRQLFEAYGRPRLLGRASASTPARPSR